MTKQRRTLDIMLYSRSPAAWDTRLEVTPSTSTASATGVRERRYTALLAQNASIIIRVYHTITLITCDVVCRISQQSKNRTWKPDRCRMVDMDAPAICAESGQQHLIQPDNGAWQAAPHPAG
jgi:hypothetical protein